MVGKCDYINMNLSKNLRLESYNIIANIIRYNNTTNKNNNNNNNNTISIHLQYILYRYSIHHLCSLFEMMQKLYLLSNNIKNCSN